MKYLFFILFLSSFFSFAEKTNTVENTSKKDKNAIKKINTDLQLAKEKSAESKFQDCIVICQKILESNPKNISKEELIETNRLMATSFIALAEIDSTQKYVNQLISLAQSHKFYKSLAQGYFIQSQIYQYKADFAQQANFSLKSIEIAKKINDKELLEVNNRNLAMLYLDHKDYDKALEYSKKSLHFANELNDKKRMSMAYGALGETYSMMYKDDKADYYFKKSYEESLKINFNIGTAWTLTNWANIKKGDDALKMREEAQLIWNSISADNIMSTINLSQIGLLYYEKSLNNYITTFQRKSYLKLAENYLFQAIEKAKKSENATTYIESAKVLTLIYFAKNDFKNAYLLQKEYQALNDSLFSQENKNKIASLESKQKILEKDKEIALKKLKIDQNEKQKSYYLIGLIFLTIIGGLLFYQNKNRKKNNLVLLQLNSELDQANSIKTRFFSILHHDLRSPISNLIDFLHLQRESPDLLDLETKNRIEKNTLNAAENLLESMEDILQWSKSQMENFKPQPSHVSVQSLFEDTQKHFSSIEHIGIEFENHNQLQLITDENYLKTILRNLTGNAIKALEETKNPIIKWKAWQEKNQTFLSITDNGKGASQDQFKALYDEKEVVGIKSGLGLHLIRDLAKAIDCEITVNSKIGEGTTFTLKF